ncbi:hypothetical protein Tco_1543327 [Tanacetum coccineum]
MTKDDGEAVKGCYKKFIDMVQVYYKTAKMPWYEKKPKEDVVESSSGNARVKDPQGKEKDDAGIEEALEEDMNKKTQFGVRLEGNMEEEAEEGSTTDSNDFVKGKRKNLILEDEEPSTTQEQSNLILEDEEPSLLMATHETEHKEILLNEGQIQPGKYATTDASIYHMTGTKSHFKDIDESTTGRVRFGDGSYVEIKGRGSILLGCRNHEQKIVSDVYYSLRPILSVHNRIFAVFFHQV